LKMVTDDKMWVYSRWHPRKEIWFYKHTHTHTHTPFFPIVKDRISKRLQRCIYVSTTVTGHGKMRLYFHRFKIIEDPTCLCEISPQTTDHLLWECELLRKQRQILRNSIMKAGGNWPITNSDLGNK
jgi:hypothetical protein